MLLEQSMLSPPIEGGSWTVVESQNGCVEKNLEIFKPTAEFSHSSAILPSENKVVRLSLKVSLQSFH